MWVYNKNFSVLDLLPSSVAKVIPGIILLLLLFIAAYYRFEAYLEQRRLKDVQAIIQHYKYSQASRSVFLDIIIQYINSPIVTMQSALKLMKKNGQLSEEVGIATGIQLDKIAKSSQGVLANAHELSPASITTIKQLEILKITSLLSELVIWLPILFLMFLNGLANFIFIQADKYDANATDIGIQIGIAIVCIAANIASYYYYRKTRNNVQLFSSQLELEKHYSEGQFTIIQQASNALNEYITTLGLVSKPILTLPRGSVFKDGIDKLYHAISALSKLQFLTQNASGLTYKTDVNEVTKQALKDIGQLSSKAGIGVVVNIDPYLFANIDETALYHLIDSTLDNAIKFSQMGSQVLLSVRAVNNGVMITVQDHGQGFSDEILHNLMLPFTRDSIEKFKFDGTGIDLYMCRLILENYNGKIAITSEPQKGTVVQMLLQSS